MGDRFSLACLESSLGSSVESSNQPGAIYRRARRWQRRSGVLLTLPSLRRRPTSCLGCAADSQRRGQPSLAWNCSPRLTTGLDPFANPSARIAYFSYSTIFGGHVLRDELPESPSRSVAVALLQELSADPGSCSRHHSAEPLEHVPPWDAKFSNKTCSLSEPDALSNLNGRLSCQGAALQHSSWARG